MLKKTHLAMLLATALVAATPAIAATKLNQGSKSESTEAAPKAKAAKAPKSTYIAADAVAAGAIPAPFAEGSKDWKREVRGVVNAQKKLTDKLRAQIERDDKIRVTSMTFPLGKDVTKANNPALFKLLEGALNDTLASTAFVQSQWAVKRPGDVSKDVTPVVPAAPGSFAYPSEHAAGVTVLAEILAQLKPALATELRTRANGIGYRRVQSGLNFPSDITAARNLAWAVLRELEKNEAYKADFAAAKAELAK